MPNKKADSSKFLKIISQIESSGGKDLDHPELKHGIHAGTAAFGKYGLMPNTSLEIANRARLAGIKDPGLQKLLQLPPEEVNDYIAKTPMLEEVLAKRLADKVLTRQGDEEKAAYSWTMGSNKSPSGISKADLESSPYVDKFKNIKKLLAEKQAKEDIPYISPEFPTRKILP